MDTFSFITKELARTPKTVWNDDDTALPSVRGRRDPYEELALAPPRVDPRALVLPKAPPGRTQPVTEPEAPAEPETSQGQAA